MIDGEERTLLAALPLAQLVFGLGQGVTPGELCKSAGFSSSDVSDHSRFAPYTRYQRLWSALRAHCPGVCVGVEFGKFLTPEHLGYAGQLFRHATSGLDLLDKLRRFAYLFDSRAARFPPSIHRDPHTISWILAPQVTADLPECAEASLFGLVAQLNAVCERPMRVVAARFRHRDRARRSAYEASFSCPMEFGCECDAVVFERDPLVRWSRRADLGVVARIEAYVAESFALGADAAFEARVHQIVMSQLRETQVSQQNAARVLGMSVRAFQRKMNKIGKNYGQVVAEARLKLAVRMLRDSDAAINEVAAHLGYEDVSSFNRAFKRWTGSTPRAYRDCRLASPMTDCGREPQQLLDH